MLAIERDARCLYTWDGGTGRRVLKKQGLWNYYTCSILIESSDLLLAGFNVTAGHSLQYQWTRASGSIQTSAAWHPLPGSCGKEDERPASLDYSLILLAKEERML